MSKELPYFRFTAFEWLNDDISLETYEIKGLFIDVCAYYWFKDCTLTKEMLEKKFSNAIAMLKQLYDIGIIKESDDGYLCIKFLDEQFDLLSEKRKKRQHSGSLGGLKRASNAKAMLKQKDSYKDKNKDKDNNEKNEIIYSKFYDSEIEKSNHNEKYIQLVKFLYGNNPTFFKLENVLSLSKQLSFEQFENLLVTVNETKVKLTDILLDMENWKDINKKETVYLTANNWMKRHAKNS